MESQAKNNVCNPLKTLSSNKYCNDEHGDNWGNIVCSIEYV